MPRLKIILQSNKLYWLLLIILIIICLLYSNKNKEIKSDNKHIVGYVIDYKKKDDKTTILLRSEEDIIVNYYNKINIKYGDHIEVDGLLFEPSNNTIPNNFNYKKYLNDKDIFYIMKASSIRVISKSNNPLYVLKNKLIRRINKIDKTGYIKAFVMGDKSSLDNYQEYQKIGVGHLFALSGMHVGFLSFVILKVFKKFKYRYIVLDLLLIIYGFIVLFPPSIQRTICFLFIKQLNDKYKLEISNIKILFLTAFILVINDIKIIKQISFIYSFICVFGLIYGSDKLNFNNRCLNIFKTSLIAGLFSLPISLSYFYEFNFLSIIYNIFYIPFVTIILYPLSLITLVLPFISFILEFVIYILESVTVFLNSFDFLKIYMSLNIVEVLIYYILLFIAFNRSYKFFFIIIMFLTIIKYSYLINRSYYIYFFDVGQGDSALIITPYRKEVIMIDTGGDANNPDYHVMEKIITFLRSQGINKINSTIITHGDFDHMGEGIYLVNNFKVDKVIFNCGPYNDLESELIKVLDKKKIKHYSCIKELNIDNNKLYFLQTKEYDNENDNSNVIYTELNGYKFMFMGDASITTEKEIIDKYNLPNIDVLKVGHHGSKTSSSKIIIDEVNPKYSIISVGKNNRYGHPNKEVLENLNNSKIYRTDKQGSIMFKIKNNKLQVETCSA